MNFKALTTELLASGLNQEQIASAVKTNQSTISRISLGEIENPKYTLASAIKQLHEHIVTDKKPLDDYLNEQIKQSA